MGLMRLFREMLAPVAAVAELAQAEQVVAAVPPGAEYVTAGLVKTLSDARELVGRVFRSAAPLLHVGRAPTSGSGLDEAGLLVLRGQRLSVLDLGVERWSVDPSASLTWTATGTPAS